VTLTWTYSGLLSMGPFDWFAAPAPSVSLREAATGGPLLMKMLSLDSVRAAHAAFSRELGVREMEAVQVRGTPYWMTVAPPDSQQLGAYTYLAFAPRAAFPVLARRYVSALDPHATFARFDNVVIEEIARAAMPASPMVEAAWLSRYDGYYYDARRSRSLPVLRVRYGDPQETWLYVDPERGSIALRNVRSTRRLRWLYHALHSFDFPDLYYRRPLWDVVVIALSGGGLVLSGVAIVPAWRRLRRHGRRAALRVRS
jgi:hypothetical protein